MSNYKDLQKEGKHLGLKVVGVSQEKLEEMITEAKANKVDSEVETASSADVNAAVVYNNVHHEVRRYTLDTHGEGFKDLAMTFANSRGYKIEYIKLEAGITCPSCGHRFDLK